MKYMNPNNYIDISMDLNEKTLVCPEDTPPKLIKILRQPKDPVNFTWLDFGSHAGTHIDAPFYLFKDKWTADQIPLERLIGLCQVLDLTSIEKIITADDLKNLAINRDKILLKTKNSFDPLKTFHNQQVILAVDAAEYLVEQGVTTLGYDYQTFEEHGSNVIHTIFLSNDVTVIDNLRLSQTAPGDYWLCCLPIKVTGIDAAPARAILFPVEKT